MKTICIFAAKLQNLSDMLKLKGSLAQLTPFAQLLLLTGLILAGLIFSSVFGMALAIPFFGTEAFQGITNLDENSPLWLLHFAKYMQIVSQIGLFILPAWLFVYFTQNKQWQYLQLSKKINGLVVIGSIVLIAAAIPLVNALVEWNQKLSLPESMAGIESWMRSTEAAAEKLTKAFLQADNFYVFLVNILMIGVLPAIGEELLFRGCLQQIFRKWMRNHHLAVWITAFLFSFIHFQFYGFVPRLLMGVLLGYLFVWSANLWVPIIIHFVNNSMAVFYYYITGGNDTGIDSIGTSQQPIIYLLLSIGIVVTMLLFIYLKTKKQRQQIITIKN